MALESVLYALVFGLVVGTLTGLLLRPFHPSVAASALPSHALRIGSDGLGLATQLMISLGAGIYEELLFRVLIVGALAWLARRLFGWSAGAAGVFATLVGALIFSAFHYVGPTGISWSWRRSRSGPSPASCSAGCICFAASASRPGPTRCTTCSWRWRVSNGSRQPAGRGLVPPALFRLRRGGAFAGGPFAGPFTFRIESSTCRKIGIGCAPDQQAALDVERRRAAGARALGALRVRPSASCVAGDCRHASSAGLRQLRRIGERQEERRRLLERRPDS